MSDQPNPRFLEAVERDFRAAFPAPPKEPFSVSLDCYEALYSDLRGALQRAQLWRDERDDARTKLRMARWIICVLWVCVWLAAVAKIAGAW